MIKTIHHAQIRVTQDKLEETILFYRDILGLEEVPKPENLKKNGGAWFNIGTDQQFHISPEKGPIDNNISNRHVCFLVEDLAEVKNHFVKHGYEIIPDKQPINEWERFYFRDPGGNRMEIAQHIA